MRKIIINIHSEAAPLHWISISNKTIWQQPRRACWKLVILRDLANSRSALAYLNQLAITVFDPHYADNEIEKLLDF